MARLKNTVEAAISAIREFYSVGRERPRRRPDGKLYSRKDTMEDAKRLGWIPEMVRKARQLSQPKSGYTVAELETLFAAMRKHADVCRFGKTHIIRMLTVPRKDRASLQVAAVKEGWTVFRLQTEISRRFGARRPGGRYPAVAPDPGGVYVQLDRMAEQWRRYVAALKKETTGKKGGESPARCPSRRIRALIIATLTPMAALQKGLAAALAKANAGRKNRGRAESARR